MDTGEDLQEMLRRATPVERLLITEILKLRRTKVDKESLTKRLRKMDQKIKNLETNFSWLHAYSKKGFKSGQSSNKAVNKFLQQNFPNAYTKFVKKHLEQAKQKLDEQETATALTQMRQPVSSSSGQKRKRGPKAVLESKMQASLLF